MHEIYHMIRTPPRWPNPPFFSHSDYSLRITNITPPKQNRHHNTTPTVPVLSVTYNVQHRPYNFIPPARHHNPSFLLPHIRTSWSFLSATGGPSISHSSVLRVPKPVKAATIKRYIYKITSRSPYHNTITSTPFLCYLNPSTVTSPQRSWWQRVEKQKWSS